MTGSATLTGRSSSAVGTTHDASKVTPCIVISLLAAKPPSPEVVHDKAPVPPGRVFLYDHIDPSWPRMFRIASCCQLPASRPAPSVHPRKRAGRGKNPFLFAMLFEKNIEIFSDPNPSVLCVFSICLPPFRAWTGGGGSAGGYNAPGLPNIQGVSSGDNCLTTHVLSIGSVWTGPLRVGYNLESAGYGYELRASPEVGIYGGMQFDASRANAIYGASPTVMPPSVNVPCITYLGLPA